MYRILLTLLILTGFLFATDHFNVGEVMDGGVESIPPSSGDYIAYYETPTSVVYIYRCTFATDSTDNYHSKPLYIGDCNAEDAFIQAKQSATGDANVILHYSADDRNVWESETLAALDQVSNTAKTGTLGSDVAFHGGRWMVIECDGQDTNGLDNTMTVIVQLKKDLLNPVTANGRIVDLANVANHSNTNP